MYDPRTAPGALPEKQACTGTDFLARVGGEIGTKGRMQTYGGGTTPVQSPMEQAISSMIPQNYSESDIENLVQTITDQIMAAAG
jgi:hypothetical protein